MRQLETKRVEEKRLTPVLQAQGRKYRADSIASSCAIPCSVRFNYRSYFIMIGRVLDFSCLFTVEMRRDRV